jgi:glyceraldehyde 3-phosphate dehydrogenase
MAVTGINGFGRFSLHLLKWWLDRRAEAAFTIDYINDDVLTLDRSFEIITTDPYVRFTDYQVSKTAEGLTFAGGGGPPHAIQYTHGEQPAIPWLGRPEVIFECSGKYTEAARCQSYLQGQTKLVLVSATSWDADKTIVFGFNHREFDPTRHRVISYGSCTVNGYVPLANFLHGQFGVIDSDVNVVHNIVLHKLPQHDTLLRKFCTLERSAPNLLPFVDDKTNFVVTYSVVPWGGVSMIDFRFRLGRPPTRDELIRTLEQAMAEGPLAGLYGMVPRDGGPEEHQCTPFSAVFVEEGIKVRGDSVYLQAYFDTENSVNRFFDTANHVIGRL